MVVFRLMGTPALDLSSLAERWEAARILRRWSVGEGVSRWEAGEQQLSSRRAWVRRMRA